MNLRYLGDALDHWKGSIFEDLKACSALQRFAVDPMASDWPNWNDDDRRLLCGLLRVEKNQVISHKASLKEDRRGYFAEILHDGDLFLDPDTGIATNHVRDAAQYVMPDEIHQLLGSNQARVVAVYQHIRAQRTRDRLNNVLGAIRQCDDLFSSTSYESPTVAMLFLSHSGERIHDIKSHFGEVLGRHAHARIGFWPALDI